MSVNKIILLGHIGKELKYKFLQTTTVINFSIATKDKDKTDWHNIVAFGKLADLINDLAKPGSKIYIEGKLQTSSWEDKDKKKQYRTEIVVSKFELFNGSGHASDEIEF